MEVNLIKRIYIKMYQCQYNISQPPATRGVCLDSPPCESTQSGGVGVIYARRKVSPCGHAAPTLLHLTSHLPTCSLLLFQAHPLREVLPGGFPAYPRLVDRWRSCDAGEIISDGRDAAVRVSVSLVHAWCPISPHPGHLLCKS